MRALVLLGLFACHHPTSQQIPVPSAPSNEQAPANSEATEPSTPTDSPPRSPIPLWGGEGLQARSGLPTGNASHIFVNHDATEVLYLRGSDFPSFVGFRSLCGTGTRALSMMNENYSGAVASPNLDRAMVERENVIELWDLRAPRRLGTWNADVVVKLASSTEVSAWIEESRVVVIGHDGQLRARHSIQVERGAWPRAFALSHSGALFAVGWSEWVDVYDTDSGRRIRRIPTPPSNDEDWIESLRFDHAAQRLAIGSGIRLRIANPRTGAMLFDEGTAHTWWGTNAWFAPDEEQVYVTSGKRFGTVGSDAPRFSVQIHHLRDVRFVDEHILFIGNRQVRYVSESGNVRAACIHSLPAFPARVVPQTPMEADVVGVMGHFVRWDFTRGVATLAGLHPAEPSVPADARFAAIRRLFPDAKLIDHDEHLDRALIYDRARTHLVKLSDGSTLAQVGGLSDPGRYFHDDWFLAVEHSDYGSTWSRRRASNGERLDDQRHAAESATVTNAGVSVFTRDYSIAAVTVDGTQTEYRPRIMGRSAVGQHEIAVQHWADEDGGDTTVTRLSLPALEEIESISLDGPVELLQYLPGDRLVSVGGGEVRVIH